MQLRYGPREENIYDIGRLLEEFPCRWKEIPREDVTIGKELGAGAFGSVVRAELKKDGKNIPCAVKMLKRTCKCHLMLHAIPTCLQEGSQGKIK